MNKIVTCYFDELVIIESLSESDTNTGKRLYDDIVPINILMKDQIKISYKFAYSKEDLIDVLDDIHQKALNSIYPIIHLECHGDQEKEGIVLANGDHMSWDDLFEAFVPINIACNLNLIVVLAACNTFHMARTIMAYKRAPFWAMLSPTEEIYPDELEKAFFLHYKKLLEALRDNQKLSGSLALDALNSTEIKKGKISFVSAEEFFALAYINYFEKQSKSRQLKLRARNICNELRKKGIVAPISKVKKTIKNLGYYYLEKFHKIFFMIDLYPENHNRFISTLIDLSDRYNLIKSKDKLDELSKQIIKQDGNT